MEDLYMPLCDVKVYHPDPHGLSVGANLSDYQCQVPSSLPYALGIPLPTRSSQIAVQNDSSCDQKSILLYLYKQLMYSPNSPVRRGRQRIRHVESHPIPLSFYSLSPSNSYPALHQGFLK
ncbi:hypothetical protein BDR04DRAFT_532166 [Suillus decipiens]|nr:hypothetical protein BDR04DRAFT_532166 [Suillus decipiens]